MAGVNVAYGARGHGLTRWQVYDWRCRVRDGRLALPERVASSPAFAALVVDEGPPRPASAAGIEIVVGDVVRPGSRHAVFPGALRRNRHGPPAPTPPPSAPRIPKRMVDRKRVGWGKRVSERVDLGGGG